MFNPNTVVVVIYAAKTIKYTAETMKESHGVCPARGRLLTSPEKQGRAAAHE